jgi:hypothetical protein
VLRTQPHFQSSQKGRALFLAHAQTLFGPQAVDVALDVEQRVKSTAATRVNNCKPTDMASVSKVIHTDNQLHDRTIRQDGLNRVDTEFLTEPYNGSDAYEGLKEAKGAV